jgi:sulfatase maturation enzyme AslB (radical SAM superfamily)
MKCKFLDHGLAIGYDHVVKPCCEWVQDSTWNQQNHISQVDLATWHQSPQVIQIRNQLEQGVWPTACQLCEQVEQNGRQDSMRGSGASAYADYNGQDITLEIRPGSVCNFACQTCWPAASSRVAQYHHQAGLIDIKNINSDSIADFDFLQSITHRIRNVVLLGGEPFYDPNCRKFLTWAEKNLQASITMFTNGSHVDWDWVDAYRGRVTMVFSIDAVGQAAEYVRYGTDWPVVLENYQLAQQHPNVELRVNITMSVYNYHLIPDVINLLVPQWPSVVSFGQPRQLHLTEVAIPTVNRLEIIQKLQSAVDRLSAADIESGQKQNAINAVCSVIANLQKPNFDTVQFAKLQQFVSKMDQVKRINIVDSASPVNFSLHC